MGLRKVILDVDTGTDDSIAIMLAVLCKKFDILGIIVTWGNQSVEDCAQNTLRVVDFLNASIPVYKGCPEPMVLNLDAERKKNRMGNKIYYFDEKGIEHHLHPKVLPFGEVKSKLQEKHAVSFLVDTLKNSKEKVTVVCVGPCTNLGMALRMEPSIKEKIEEVVFMGGSVGMGNVTKTAEANFWHDPEAVKIILSSKVDCVIATLNATSSIPLTLEDVKELEEGNEFAKKAAEIVRIRMDVSKHLGWTNGEKESVHDPLAISYLIDPSVATKIKKQKTDIEIKGVLEGTLMVEDDESSNVSIIYEADHTKYLDLWKEYL